jgi:hypothetical protein
MAVTRQSYVSNPVITQSGIAGLFEQAFIDAGLMAGWHDSFNASNTEFRVLKVDYGVSNAYVSTFYCFSFGLANIGLTTATSFNTISHQFLGTQWLDFHQQPTSSTSVTSTLTSVHRDFLGTHMSVAVDTRVELWRYSSGVDARQSWFQLAQGVNVGRPFTILRGDLPLYPWVDTNKGTVPGFTTVRFFTNSRVGTLGFTHEDQNRRTLLSGMSLHLQQANSSTQGAHHNLNHWNYRYVGVGRQENNSGNNLAGLLGSTGYGGVMLPVGYSAANPGYTIDYTPICNQVPWSPFSPTPLASDFGVYMHYAHNTMTHQDRFVVAAGTEEWEILGFNLNTVVDFGATPCFLARIV